MRFKIIRNNKNIEFFGIIRSIADVNGVLINEIKLLASEIQFSFKNDDLFCLCEFLTPDQNENFINLIEPVL